MKKFRNSIYELDDKKEISRLTYGQVYAEPDIFREGQIAIRIVAPSDKVYGITLVSSSIGKSCGSHNSIKPERILVVWNTLGDAVHDLRSIDIINNYNAVISKELLYDLAIRAIYIKDFNRPGYELNKLNVARIQFDDMVDNYLITENRIIRLSSYSIDSGIEGWTIEALNRKLKNKECTIHVVWPSLSDFYKDNLS